MKYISPEMLMQNAIQNYTNPILYKAPFAQTQGGTTYTKLQLDKSIDDYLSSKDELPVGTSTSQTVQVSPAIGTGLQPVQSTSQSSNPTIETFESKTEISSTTILKIIILILALIILVQFFKIENQKTIIRIYKLNQLKNEQKKLI